MTTNRLNRLDIVDISNKVVAPKQQQASSMTATRLTKGHEVRHHNLRVAEREVIVLIPGTGAAQAAVRSAASNKCAGRASLLDLSMATPCSCLGRFTDSPGWDQWDDADDIVGSEDATNLDFLIIFEGCFSEGLHIRTVQHLGRDFMPMELICHNKKTSIDQLDSCHYHPASSDYKIGPSIPAQHPFGQRVTR